MWMVTFSKFHLTVDVPPREVFLDLIHANTSFMLAPLTSDCTKTQIVRTAIRSRHRQCRCSPSWPRGS